MVNKWVLNTDQSSAQILPLRRLWAYFNGAENEPFRWDVQKMQWNTESEDIMTLCSMLSKSQLKRHVN